MGEGMKEYTKNFCLFCLGIALAGGSTQSVGASTEKNEELKEIVVGCDEYEPYNYFDKNGNLVGIDADLAEEAFNRMGYSPTYVLMKWTEKDSYLENGVTVRVLNSYETLKEMKQDGMTDEILKRYQADQSADEESDSSE